MMSTSISCRLVTAVVLLSGGVCMEAAARPLEITGTILDDQRGALAGARLELVPLMPPHRVAAAQLAGEPRPAAVARTRTDADGRYRLAAPKPGFWRVRAIHGDYLPVIHDLMPLRMNRQLPDVGMVLRSDLAVRLLDAEGQPMAGVMLAARGWSRKWQEASREGWWPAERRARTGEDGTAAVPCASSERVSLAGLVAERLIYRVEPCVSGFVELRLDGELSAVSVVHPGGEPAATVYGFVRWPFIVFGSSDENGRLRGPFSWLSSVPVAFADAEAYYGEPRRLGPAEADEGVPILELPPTLPVPGRIVDAVDGRAIDTAWIWGEAGTRYFQIVEDGEPFRLRVPAAAPEMRFGAPGYVAMTHGLSVDDTDQVIRLVPARTLVGRVVDTAGYGIAGAEVRGVTPPSAFFGSSHGKPRATGRWLLGKIEATTDATGSFELGGLLPSTRTDLRVVRSGFVSDERTVPSLDPGVPDEELVIILQPGYSGFGRVVNESEMPIAGAEVALIPSLTGAAAGHDFQVGENFGARTLGDGAFTVRDVPPGTYYLSARARGFPELLVPGIEMTASPVPFDLGIVVLVPGIRLAGRVVDGEGEPVPAAELSLRHTDGEPIVVQRAGSAWFASATSRENGSFEFEGLPRASRLTLLVAADGFLPREEAVTTGDRDQRLVLEISAGATVSGVVVDPRGRPATNTEVRLEAIGSLPTSTSRRITSDERGLFEANGLQPGEYRITARAEEARSDPVRRAVPPAGLEDLYLELRWKSSLQVAVLDPEGAPMLGVNVSAKPTGPSAWRRGAAGHTDEAGVAVVRPLDPGPHEVTAFHLDFESVSAPAEVVDGATNEIELRFEARRDLMRHRVAGRVIDESAAPVGGARLSLLRFAASSATTSEPDGRFELLAAAGQYRLGCDHESHAGYLSEPFDLGEGGVTDLEIRLTAGATVVGRVSGLEPEELARLVITGRGPLDVEGGSRVFGRRYGSINFAGELRIPGLSAGEWIVRAELLNPTRSATERVEVGGAGEVPVELRFEAGYRVTGSVLRQGQPIAGRTVRLSCFGEFRGETFTDADGRFVIDHVPEGPCSAFSMDAESGLRVDQDLEVLGDTEVILEIGFAGL